MSTVVFAWSPWPPGGWFCGTTLPRLRFSCPALYAYRCFLSLFVCYLPRLDRSERRPYMRAAYALFKGDSTEGDLAKQMEIAPGNIKSSGAPYFYANLYLGLYAEAKGDAVLARKCEQRKKKVALNNKSCRGRSKSS